MTAQTWYIPKRVWFLLMSWGLAVLVMAGLVSYWVWYNQHEQDEVMCEMTEIMISGPAPVAGPSGDRARAVLAAMHRYRDTLGCD